MISSAFGRDVLEAGEVVWVYLCLRDKLTKSCAILCLGSFDTAPARYAAQLYREKWAPRLIFSGGVAHANDLAATGWNEPEAEIFAKLAESEGVPRAAIIAEAQSTNTGENFSFTRAELARLKFSVERVIVVTKPYMTRRARATAEIVWPNIRWVVHHEPTRFDDYIAAREDPERILQVMAGDMHRILVYPALGFQSPQDVRPHVFAAFRYLVSRGYTKHLVKGYEP